MLRSGTSSLPQLVAAADGLKKEARLFNTLMGGNAVTSVSAENKTKLSRHVSGYASRHPIAFLASWSSILDHISREMGEPGIGKLRKRRGVEGNVPFTREDTKHLVETFQSVFNTE